VTGRPDRLTWLGHSTAVIDLDGVRLVTDPVVTGRIAHLRRVSGQAALPGGVDAALVSHLHHDHLHGPSLRRLAPARVVTPRGAGRHLRRSAAEIIELDEGDEAAVGALRIRAVHAEHDGRRGPGRRAVPALGYVVRGTRAVYFAGDTGLFPAMAGLAAERLDVALLPVWGWGPTLGRGLHMDPLRAAESLRRIRPRAAVPIHWGTYWPHAMGRIFPERLVEPPAAFAEYAAELAPDVRVLPTAVGSPVGWLP
jgi:L-ascorbate metabolism protein UlaG (beta-lactamase superfamily)